MATSKRRSGRILILVALLLILIIAAVAFFLWRNPFRSQQAATQLTGTPTPPYQLVNVVVLTQPIAMGDTFKENMLSTIPYPKEKMVEGLFYTDIKQVVGKRSKYPLEAGIVLNRALISDTASGSFAALQIPRGYVAISIPISRLTSVSYALRSGDHVNIIGSFILVDIDPNFQTRLPNFTASVVTAGPLDKSTSTASITITTSGATSAQGRGELDPVLNQPVYVVPSEGQRGRLVSQTIVQDAIVLWVGEFPYAPSKSPEVIQPTPTPTPIQGQQTTPQAPIVPNMITLVVSPQDAVTLNYMMLAGGGLNLVLRGAGDTQKIPTEAVTLQFVMDQYNIPLPAKLPYGLEPRKDKLEYPPVNPEVVVPPSQ